MKKAAHLCASAMVKFAVPQIEGVGGGVRERSKRERKGGGEHLLCLCCLVFMLCVHCRICVHVHANIETYVCMLTYMNTHIHVHTQMTHTEIIDSERRVKHSKLSEKTEEAITNPTRIQVKLRGDNVDIAYPPIFQSGGEYDTKVCKLCGWVGGGICVCGVMCECMHGNHNVNVDSYVNGARMHVCSCITLVPNPSPTHPNPPPPPPPPPPPTHLQPPGLCTKQRQHLALWCHPDLPRCSIQHVLRQCGTHIPRRPHRNPGKGVCGVA